MTPAYDPSKIVLPSALARRELESSLMFRRRTIWIVHVAMIVGGLGFFLWGQVNRTALLTPVDPDFHAFMIGVGIFVGILVAAVEREAWLLDIGQGLRSPPKGAGVLIGMVALVAASGFAGNFLAARLWEWQAFRAIAPIRVDQAFTIVGRQDTRSGHWLDLTSQPGAEPFSITCSHEMYQATRIGERLVLTVETGRRGMQRVTLPPLKALRRG